jgi:eukaryotic-like serine/threonine-protein kinase
LEVPEPSTPLVADRLLGGRYRLAQPLASGGMAQVWEGRDEVLARPVAVKVLHPHLAADPDFRERFRREAIAAARLAHPNVVSTFDATSGSDGESPAFIIMELVRGQTLREVLDQRGPLPPAEAVAIAAQVADALGAAHAAGLLHRDVKPGNIIVCETPDGPVQVKVADFGIAKVTSDMGSDLTHTGSLLGTAKYLAPEQVEGGEPDARSDLYALGAVLYEMLCGKPPFKADTELATALVRLTTDPTAPRRLRPGIPRPLEDVVLWTLQRDPNQRPQTAVQLRHALLNVDLRPDDAVPLVQRDPTPTNARLPSTAAKRRTNRAVWVATIVVGVLAVAALGGAAVLLQNGNGTPSPSRSPAVSANATPIQITRAEAVQAANGGGDLTPATDHPDSVGNAIDGNENTTWETFTYSGPDFGRLKSGVGLVLTLPGNQTLHNLQITSSTPGWAASVYVAGEPPGDLNAWGPPVDSKSNIDGSTTFSLKGHKGSVVLLWITDPGTDFRAQIAEVKAT